MSLWVHLITTGHLAGSVIFLYLYIINAYSSQKSKVVRSLLGMKESVFVKKVQLRTFWQTWWICLRSFIQNFPAINILLDSISFRSHVTVITGKTRELKKLSGWLFKLLD